MLGIETAGFLGLSIYRRCVDGYGYERGKDVRILYYDEYIIIAEEQGETVIFYPYCGGFIVVSGI